MHISSWKLVYKKMSSFDILKLTIVIWIVGIRPTQEKGAGAARTRHQIGVLFSWLLFDCFAILIIK